ncbi:MAG: FAD-binding oxidoreductase [Pseudomonadota bacterium]
MEILETLRAVIGPSYVLTGKSTEKWARDWTGKYAWTPLAVVRPASTVEVSAVASACYAAGAAMVPVGGNTGLTGATKAQGVVMVSLDRLNAIRAIKPESRVAVVEGGAILDTIHSAAADHDLIFPLTFGARGSAMIGGNLATNAGGSNVLRYGNTRDLCLGLEIVLPDGRIMDLMSELRKDNTGYDLRHLFIGSEGTLGFITAAVLKLFPAPCIRATAMVALSRIEDTLPLLNALQAATGGAVEAFEFMPRNYIERHIAHTGEREPFAEAHRVNILLEAASTRADDAAPGEDGTPALTGLLQTILADEMGAGRITDAVVAQNEAQRKAMWARREMAAELTFYDRPIVDTDIAVPVDSVPEFLARARARVTEIDPGCEDFMVSHLGDGNVHYSVYTTSGDAGLYDRIVEAVEDVTLSLGGSFSAEHGIGLSKLASMSRRKDDTALEVMQAMKAALDPKGLMNPGKVLPAPREDP